MPVAAGTFIDPRRQSIDLRRLTSGDFRRRIYLAARQQPVEIMRSAVGILIAIVLSMAATGVSAAAANPLTAPEALRHVGENATVCGIVASTRYSAKTKGQPTFLNLDVPYPRQIFTVLIWGVDRPKFGTPEITLMGRRVCATGTIQLYRGKAEIVVSDPGRLTSR